MNSPANALFVGPARTTDWKFVHELCCRTGNLGDPIDPARWPFFGEQWVGPYERLLPEWTFVVRAAERPLGYLTGCPDTAAFLVKRRILADWPLTFRILRGHYPRSAETRRFVRRSLGLERGPEESFSPDLRRELLAEFPAHLHMNVESFARGTGAGRALLAAYRENLAAIGVRGIHLFCGNRPLPFYRKMGFRELARIEFRPDVFVYALGSAF